MAELFGDLERVGLSRDQQAGACVTQGMERRTVELGELNSEAEGCLEPRAEGGPAPRREDQPRLVRRADEKLLAQKLLRFVRERYLPGPTSLRHAKSDRPSSEVDLRIRKCVELTATHPC
jgi:hypothetical protein